jgi:hypothetical protein
MSAPSSPPKRRYDEHVSRDLSKLLFLLIIFAETVCSFNDVQIILCSVTVVKSD